jgi:hypothetical protein
MSELKYSLSNILVGERSEISNLLILDFDRVAIELEK